MEIAPSGAVIRMDSTCMKLFRPGLFSYLIDCKFGHQVAPFKFNSNLATRRRQFQSYKFDQPLEKLCKNNKILANRKGEYFTSHWFPLWLVKLPRIVKENRPDCRLN